MARRVLIVGGVAGGASCAARLRRLDESAEIVLFDRGPHVSFANCGLPYFVGDVITEERSLLVASPSSSETGFASR
jgi:NADPH-dependent 2,4-dienoyl-CoA reductase/sulfur reductase-like enzyme